MTDYVYWILLAAVLIGVYLAFRKGREHSMKEPRLIESVFHADLDEHDILDGIK
jgi:hypothetical protein